MRPFEDRLPGKIAHWIVLSCGCFLGVMIVRRVRRTIVPPPGHTVLHLIIHDSGDYLRARVGHPRLRDRLNLARVID